MITIGPEELEKLPSSLTAGNSEAPESVFAPSVLALHANTHLLIFTPKTYTDGTSITLASLRARLGVDPTISEPCFYNQDWYLKEDFAAKETADGQWHLIRKDVLEDARAQRPEEIEASLMQGEAFPTAVTYAFAFFAYWFYTGGERLWNHDFVWCRDRDHNGDRIYVGRYEDQTGINKNGFNIHRHLALRLSYSAAPEIIA